MLAPSTLNMLPKFELAPILMYLVMLPKTLRPSMTPSPSTARLFSSRMMSADSLAISTAVSTEMPTSAAFSAGPSLMPSPRKPTTWPLALQRCDDPRLLRRRDLGEHRMRLDQRGRAPRRHAPRSRAPSTMRSTVEPHLAADLAGDDVVVAGQDLHRDAGAAERGDRGAGALLGRIEEGDVAEQGQVALVGDRIDVACGIGDLLVGDGDDAEAVGVERARLLLASGRDGSRRARRSRRRSRSGCRRRRSPRPRPCRSGCACRRRAPSTTDMRRRTKSNGISSILSILMLRVKLLAELDMLQHRDVEQVLQARTGSGC